MLIGNVLRPQYDDIKWDEIEIVRRKTVDRRIDYVGFYFIILSLEHHPTYYLPNERTPLSVYTDDFILRLLDVAYQSFELKPKQIISIETEAKKRGLIK